MRTTKVHKRSRQPRQNRQVGTFDQLESRQLLAPVLVNGTVYQLPTQAPGFINGDGFISLRLISTQTGRIETDPTGAFGGDLFVISGGRTPTGTGLVPTVTVNTPDVAGFIYRVDPYGANAFGASPALNRRFFASVPAGTVASSEGYERWFDIAFDPTGSFSAANGGPTMFVSTIDSTSPAGSDPTNAIYAFNPDGDRAVPVFAQPTVTQSQIFNSQIGAIAVAPGDTFGRDLYALDVACVNSTNICETAGDGNTLFRVQPGQLTPVNMDAAPTPLNGHAEDVLPPVTPPPAADMDLDVRAMAFDPNRGILLQGQFGEPAFQYLGGLFVASSDIENTSTQLSRLIQFPAPTATPIEIIPAASIQTRLFGDMTIDPVGHFGGGIFFTDYVTRSVVEVVVDPATGLSIGLVTIANNFNVLPPPVGSPVDSYLDSEFSIAFSADGETMFVSDRDGVWAFYANTLAQSAAGTVMGLTDIRELRAPYTGQGLAAAVIDSGVDGAHLGFRGTVAPGITPAYPAPGNFDQFLVGHGTNVAGIVHQIAPNSVIVPIQALGVTGSTNDLYKSIQYVRDNPAVDDPRTPQREATPIVAVNMSLGIRAPDDPDNALVSEQDAFLVDQNVVLTFKSIFQDYRRLGIVPVAASGNEGQLFNGMNGSIIPAVLNEVVEVIGSYPFGFSPPLPQPPLTIGAAAIADRCTIQAGDVMLFPGKVAAFSNRSRVSDFAAPGTCVNTYALSGLSQFNTPGFQTARLGTIFQDFAGTSASTPIVTGTFLLGFDAIRQWLTVASKGGVISPTDPALTELHEYLTRELGLNTVLTLGASVPDLSDYNNPDGVNSILQWSSIPREDVNIGESFDRPAGIDDDVAQRRLQFTDRYRTYSHVNIANFLSSLEGTIALRYFLANPAQLAALNAASLDGTGPGGVPVSRPEIISADDIQCFFSSNVLTLTVGGRLLPDGVPCAVSDPSVYNPTARAMASLLGGTDRIARLNRVSYFDTVQDERVDGGILTGAEELLTLLERLMPGPRDFVITERHRSAEQAYSTDSAAMRNYHDLKFAPISSMLAPNPGKKFRKKSPDQLRLGTRGLSQVTLLPVREGVNDLSVQPQQRRFHVVGNVCTVFPERCVIQRDNPLGHPGEPGEPEPPPPTSPSNDNLTALNESGIEFLYSLNGQGELMEHQRRDDGSWTVSNLSTAAGGTRVHSDLVAMDIEGFNTRTVFGLNAQGHVVQFSNASGRWVASDLTAAAGLPTLAGSLTAIDLSSATRQELSLYGLNAAGQLIEYRMGPIGWTSRNITVETRGPELKGRLVAWGEPGRRGTLRIYVFGVTEDGRVNQFTWTGRTWARLDLTAAPNGPMSTGEGLTLVPPAPAIRTLPSIYALDTRGNLLNYTGNYRTGWQSISAISAGPSLSGELSAQWESGTDTTYVFGRDSQGQLVEYSGRGGSWTWNIIAPANAGSTGDLVASSQYRVAYSDLVDAMLGEFFLTDDWNFRRLAPDTNNAGAGDGSMATNRLMTL